MAPTTADLIEALRRPGESYEDLASRLPISLSTVNRWKKRSPQDWNGLLRMLEMAGWLTTNGAARQDGAAPADPLAALAAGVNDLTDGQASLVDEIRAVRALLEAGLATTKAPPKRKGG